MPVISFLQEGEVEGERGPKDFMASLWPGLVAEGCSLSYVWDRGTMERITRSKPDSDIVNSRLIWVI